LAPSRATRDVNAINSRGAGGLSAPTASANLHDDDQSVAVSNIATPMDGGGIAIADGRLVTVWRREHDIFLDTPGAAENRIGAGVDGAIAAGTGGVYVIWSTPSGVQVMLPKQSQPIEIAPTGSFPALVTLPAGALAAWEDDGLIAVHRIP
jgi:hypothetical protein